MDDLSTAVFWGMIIASGIIALAAIIEAARELMRADRSIELADELFDKSWGGER